MKTPKTKHKNLETFEIGIERDRLGPRITDLPHGLYDLIAGPCDIEFAVPGGKGHWIVTVAIEDGELVTQKWRVG